MEEQTDHVEVVRSAGEKKKQCISRRYGNCSRAAISATTQIH